MNARDEGSDEGAVQPITAEELGPLWDAWRAGPAPCPRCGGALALAVDGAPAYRLVCVRCGSASSWFESDARGVRVREGTPSTFAPRRPPGEASSEP